MLPSGYYVRCMTCGRLFPEGCVRQIPQLAKCDTCKFNEEERKNATAKTTERNNSR